MTAKEINEQIKAQSRNTIKWSVKNLKDIYKDDWDYIIQDEIRRQFVIDSYDDLKILETKELNLLKRVVNEISTIYKNPAERQAILSESEDKIITDEVYENIVKKSNLHVVQKAVNRYTNLTNNVLQRVVWRDNKIDYDIMTFDNCEILSDPDDWKKIIAIKFYMGFKLPMYDDNFKNVTQDGKVQNPQAPQNISNSQFEDYSYSYLYTIEGENSYIYKYQKIGKEGKLVERKDNPYKDKEGNPVLPFVLYTKNYPVDGLLDFTSGSDLMDLNINVAINMMHLNTLIKYSSWKQVYMATSKPASIPNNIAMAVNKVMVLPLDKEGRGQIGTLDIQSSIKEFWETLLDRMRTGISQYGLDAESFQRSGSGESGIKLKIKKEGLMELREDQLPLYRESENKLFEITRIVNNYHNIKKINENATFNIDFGEIKFQSDEEAEARTWTIKIQNNVSTAIDWIKADNPDLDDDKAEIKYKENKAINQSSKGGVVIQPLNKPEDQINQRSTE